MDAGVELHAPPHWGCVDFISDIHLQSRDTATFGAWSQYLRTTVADAVFVLGDLFEVWIGDDVLDTHSPFEQACVDVLRAASQRLEVFVLHGNRDFLMGSSLMAVCQAKLLPDPCVLDFAQHRWVLSHGDAWCIADAEYQQFRQMARSSTWQQTFLQKPLDERRQIARTLRSQSEAHKQVQVHYADVDTILASAALNALGADHLIHGHTHQPARHTWQEAGQNTGQKPGQSCMERLVLSDWDSTAMPPRAEVLRLRRCQNNMASPYTLERIPPSMAAGVRTPVRRVM